ncbi:MAG: methyltransferase domain-containing protein [Dehalococcoidales bacterium]|nr:methyltransferase domain-containing protein [Dehalococcoidales bacterium]
MPIALIIIIIIIAGIAVWQLAVWISEIRYKNRQCRAAVDCSRKRQKPMLIAGGPWGGHSLRRRFNMPAHTQGDVCIDIKASAILDWPNGIVADVTYLPFPDKTFGSAFASHLLEHLPNTISAKQALAELSRVADEVFIAYPSRQSLPAWLIRDHHLWVWQKDGIAHLTQRGNGSGTNQEELYNLTDGQSN